jgi:hypothetical protein
MAPSNSTMPANRFLAAVESCADGDFLVDLDAHVKELVAAIASTGKRGTLTVTIAMQPTKKSGLVELSARASLKLPSVEPSSTFLYANEDDYSLSREDPRQPKLPGVGPAEVKSFARTAGDAHE